MITHLLDTHILSYALRPQNIGIAEKLTLVTHNTRHFERIAGLKLEDWRG